MDSDSLTIIEISDPKQWSQRLGECVEADLQQTWEYGEAVRACIDWRPVRQMIFHGDLPVALAQVLVKTVPVLGNVARIQHGPIFIAPAKVSTSALHSAEAQANIETSALHSAEAQADIETSALHSAEAQADIEASTLHSAEAQANIDTSARQTAGLPESAEAVMAALRRHWVMERGSLLHATPYLFDEVGLPDGFAARTGFRLMNEAIWQSIRVDLTRSEEALRKRLKRRWRTPLQKAEKAGLGVEVCNGEADIAFFLERYHEATVRKGFSWPSPDLVREMWNHAPETPRLIFSTYKGERIGAMVLHRFATTAFCLVAWNSEAGETYHAHNLLIWQSVLYAKSAGAKWLDLGGIDPETLPGITRFKQGVGGEAYRLVGNFEARPETAGQIYRPAPTHQKEADFRQGLGHVLTGLSLPAREAMEDDLLSAVTDFIAGFVRKLHGDDLVPDDRTPLIEDGIIDSLSLVTMVQTLQQRFGVEIGVQEITLENFNTIQAIRDFIKRRTKNP